jgi:predicted RNase H-like HicB family nuclease
MLNVGHRLKYEAARTGRMSSDAEARITLALDGEEWFATDEATGTTGHGETREAALEHLDELLALERGEIEYDEAFVADVETGRDQAERGETRSADEVKRTFGLDG